MGNVSVVTMLYAAVLLAVLTVCASQAVTVDVPFVSVDNGTQVMLNCSYSITGNGYSVNRVQWSFGEEADAVVPIASFLYGSLVPIYYGDYAHPAYIATRTEYKSELVIAESRYEKDDGTYRCRVRYSKGSEQPTGSDSGNLEVKVLVSSRPTFSNETHEFEEGFTIDLLAGDQVQFSCMVSYVKPTANFTWKYGIEKLESKHEDVLNDNGLYNSTSHVDLTAKLGMTQLTCTATNKPGLAGKSALVLLNVTDKPTPEPPGGLSIGITIAIVVAACVVVVGITALVVYCCKQKGR